MTKRILSLLLAALLITSAVSCGSETDPETSADPGTTGIDTAAVETEETETEVALNIPKEDNGGRTFQMLVPTEKSYGFVEESTGETVNDAVYNRSLITEDHFNIKFQYQYDIDSSFRERIDYTEYRLFANSRTAMKPVISTRSRWLFVVFRWYCTRKIPFPAESFFRLP